MGRFVECNLIQNEELVYRGKIHWASLIQHVAPIVIIIGLLTLLNIGHTTKRLVITLVVIIGLIRMIRPVVEMFTTELGLTSKRIIGKVGLINTRSMDAPLNKINNVTIQNNFWGRIFGYGTIYASTSSGSYFYRYIAKPENFRQAVMNQIDEFDSDRIKQQALEMAKAMQSVAAAEE